MEIVPKTLATGTNDPGKQVSKDVWNAGHKLRDMAAGTIPIGQGAGADAEEKAISGDATLAASGALTIAGGFYRAGGTDVAVADGGTGASAARVACANLAAVHTLAHSASAVSGPADTAENTLATITVPANALGANGALRIETLWTVNNDASAKTIRIRFSGASGTIFFTLNLANMVSYNGMTLISNRAATNSQVGSPSILAAYGNSTSAVITAAVDTTAETTIVITAQKADGTDTMTLERYLAQLIVP